MTTDTRLGRYEVKEVIGRGGMGIVYIGVDPVIGRQVAIKAVVVPPNIDGERSTQVGDRFRREFQVAGTLSHPHIVTVYDVGQEGPTAFMAMELIGGSSLGRLLADGKRFSYREIGELATQMCSALDYAHGEGVIHRDVKPANILLKPDGVVKITDFGIARLADSDLTQTGTVLGTPRYMSPEQVTGGELTGASDQFSLGVILYELLTGSCPFGGTTPSTLLYNIVHEPPEPPTRVVEGLPPAVNDVLLRALDKDPAERFPSCIALAEALSGALSDLPGDDLPAGVVLDEGDDSTVRLEDDTGNAAARDGKVPPEAPGRPPSSQRVSRRFLWVATVVFVLLVGLSLWVQRRGVEGPTIPEQHVAGAQVQQSLRVAPSNEGLSVWVDSADSGLTTPVEIDLNGAVGQAVLLQLKSDDKVVAERVLKLSSWSPGSWDPSVEPVSSAEEPGEEGAPQAQLELQVVSDPPGAALTVGGRAGENPTPTLVQAAPGTEISLVLEGYGPISVKLDPQRLEVDEQGGRTLSVVLLPTEPPGRIDPAVKTFRAGVQVEKPRLLLEVPPVYPEAAREAGVTGTVILELVVDTNGLVAESKVLKSLSPELDAAAFRAAIARRYEPTVKGDKPVNVNLVVSFSFPAPEEPQ